MLIIRRSYIIDTTLRSIFVREMEIFPDVYATLARRIMFRDGMQNAR